MRETSASNGAAYFASAPAALSAAVPLRPRQDDYAWTHSAARRLVFRRADRRGRARRDRAVDAAPARTPARAARRPDPEEVSNMRPLRLVPDNTQIRFMRGRLAGPLVSAVLSIASVVLFFWPGVNYGVDFRGGVVVELRTARGRRSRRAAQRLRGAAARRGQAPGVRLAARRARHAHRRGRDGCGPARRQRA